MDQIFGVLADNKGKILKIKVETPRKSIPPKDVIECNKYGDTP